jgi:hypothetical protein
MQQSLRALFAKRDSGCEAELLHSERRQAGAQSGSPISGQMVDRLCTCGLRRFGLPRVPKQLLCRDPVYAVGIAEHRGSSAFTAHARHLQYAVDGRNGKEVGRKLERA